MRTRGNGGVLKNTTITGSTSAANGIWSDAELYLNILAGTWPIKAIGGTVTKVGAYTYHTFTTSGTFTLYSTDRKSVV